MAKAKSELEIFQEIVDDIWELVFGWSRRPKPKRARKLNGKYKADIKETKDYNEAWVGGKAPKTKRRKSVGTKKKTTRRTKK